MENKKIKILEEKIQNNLQWQKDFIKCDVIGSGQFGQVYRYTNFEKTKNFAVKIMNYYEKNLDLKNKIIAEIDFLFTLSEMPKAQKYFPVFYGYVHYREKTKEGDNKKIQFNYALILELAKGHLKALVLGSRPDGISFAENLALLKCLASGLSILQKKKISHRDLKPENVLYNFNKGSISFKVIDFSEVKINVEDDGTVRGSPIYFSPETNFVFLNDEVRISEEYNPFKSDAYSIGLMFLFVNLLDVPFERKPNVGQSNNNISTMKTKNLRRYKEKNMNPFQNDEGPYDDTIKEAINKIYKKFKNEPGIKIFKNILEKCLEYNPKNRYDLIDLKNAYSKLKAKLKIKDDSDEEDVMSFKILNEKNQMLLMQLEKEIKEKENAQTTLKEIIDKTHMMSINEEFKSSMNSSKYFDIIYEK